MNKILSRIYIVKYFIVVNKILSRTLEGLFYFFLVVCLVVGLEVSQSCSIERSRTNQFLLGYQETIPYVEMRVRETDHRPTLNFKNDPYGEIYQYYLVNCTTSLSNINSSLEYLNNGRWDEYAKNLFHIPYSMY